MEITRQLLAGLGAESHWEDDRLLVDSTGCRGSRLDPGLAGQLRSSSLFLGALLCAGRTAEIPLPGGCVIGARPLDLHLQALRTLGAETACTEGNLCCTGPLEGGTAILRFPSVGATENLMLAALSARGPVRILGAAREPEIADLAAFLNRCGARITGAGTPRITIEPAPLHGCIHTVLPDRIEAATWLCAAACTGGALTLNGAIPDHLRPVLRVLSRAGCLLTEDEAGLHIQAGPLRAVGPIVTGPYPAFPTDAQAPIMAALACAAGTTVLEETVFEDRFRHVPALRRLGAEIELAGRLARIRGVGRLYGAELRATDLRGGAAMLCAALGAEGESLLTNASLLERGYQDLIPTLARLGAEIRICA